MLKAVYPFWANLYQKLPISAILGALSLHIKSDNCEIWHKGAGVGVPPHTKFCKNRFRGYTPLKQIYTKNYQFWRFCASKPTFFKATTVKFRVRQRLRNREHHA